jgi:hypothetical protein
MIPESCYPTNPRPTTATAPVTSMLPWNHRNVLIPHPVPPKTYYYLTYYLCYLFDINIHPFIYPTYLPILPPRHSTLTNSSHPGIPTQYLLPDHPFSLPDVHKSTLPLSPPIPTPTISLPATLTKASPRPNDKVRLYSPSPPSSPNYMAT